MAGLEDCGIFVSFTTIPLGGELDFYAEQIEEGIFSSYKKNLEKHLSNFKEAPECKAKQQEFEAHFYKPKSYALLGNYDVATIALVDDFAFSYRVFHPYNPLMNQASLKGEQPDNFSYKTIIGGVPDLSGRQTTDTPANGSYLIKKAQQTFLTSKATTVEPDSVFPFIGFCSLKINNGLLIGTGNKLMDLVLKALKNEIEKSMDFIEGRLDYIIMQSFSWNELTIVFFSDSFKKITESVLNLRRLSLQDLKIYDLDGGEEVERNCLFTALKENLGEDTKISQTQVFARTHTTFGFDFELLQKGIPSYFKQWDIEDLNLYTKLYVKPGHLNLIVPKLNKLLSHQQGFAGKATLLIGGRGDFLYAKENNFDQFRELISLLTYDKTMGLAAHLEKVYTIPELFYPLDKLYDTTVADTEAIPDFQTYLKQYTFLLEEIDGIRRKLKKDRVSKILRDKIIKTFVTYNDCILDPTLFGYFIELRPFLQKVLEDIHQMNRNERYALISDLSEELDELSAYFEKAHRNRFHQSHIMNEITDYNIEFNGGVQQIVSAFDGAYKSISNILGDDGSYQSFVYVTGYSGIDSNVYNVRLNYYHLFQPELFVANATHEAANKLLDQRQYPKLNEYYAYLISEESPYPLAVSYFLVDVLTYYLAYNRDMELFYYWHWSTFLQTSLYYNKEGDINENMFQQFLLRMMLLLHFMDERSGESNSEKLLKSKAPCEALQDLWDRNFLRIKAKLQDLLEDKMISSWMEAATTAAEIITIDDFCGLMEKNVAQQSTIEDIYNRILVKQHEVGNEDRFFKQFSGLDIRERLVLGGRIEEMQEISQAIKKSFEEGKTFQAKPYNIIESSSFYIHSMFYAYLRLIMEINQGEINMLNRDEAGEVSIPEKEKEIYLDSTGGHYNCDYSLRRKYFQYRYILLKSLWGVSLTFKKNYVEPNRKVGAIKMML